MAVVERSRARATTIERGAIHVAVVGLQPVPAPLTCLGGHVTIRAIAEPPGVLSLAGKGTEGDGDYLAIARNVANATCEVVLHRPRAGRGG